MEQSSDHPYLIIHGRCYQKSSKQQFKSVSQGHSSLAPRKEENAKQHSAAGETNTIGKDTLLSSHTSPIIHQRRLWPM